MSQRMEELMVTKVEHVSDEMPMDMDWAEGLRMKIGVDELNDTDSQNVKDEPVSEDYEEASTSQIAKKCKDEPDSATISDSFQISAVFHVGGSDDSNDSTVNPVSISQLSSSALISGTTHGVFCKECGKILSKGQTAFQPKGSSKMYCSVECLASVNTQNKTCFHCSRELSGTESMVSAQLDPADTMKDFCSQKCLSAMSFSCQVCQKTSLVYTHTINFSGVVHKLCSYDCFNQFCSTNNICENCGVSCNNLGSTRFTLQIENRIMTFCKHNCKESFKKKFSNPVSCKMCQNKCALSDMMECLNTDGTQELYCSSSCITAKNNQGVGLSDAAVECFNCKKNVPLKYHVALPHGTLRKFCSYSCVDAYQEVYSKGNSSSQPVTTKSKSSLKRPAESSSSGKTGQTVTKIPCSQCHTSFFHKPELLEFKRKMYAFCVDTCAEEFRKDSNISARCEHCKREAIVKHVKRIDKVDRFFCSVDCTHLYYTDLVKRWGEKHCRRCFYCSGSAQTQVRQVVGDKEEEFCGNICATHQNLLTRQELKCSMCKQKKMMRESVQWLGEMKHFCSLQCLMFFCSLQGTVVKAWAGKSLPEPRASPVASPATSTSVCALSPVISNVMSLAKPSNEKPVVPGRKDLQGYDPVAPLKRTETLTNKQADVAKTATSAPSPTPVLKNKAVLCKPVSENKGTSCKPNVFEMSTQTEEPYSTVLPVPVPVYVPLPMNLYTQYTPKPVGFPLPVPVPMFFPTNLDSAEGIAKTIQQIKDKTTIMTAEEASKEQNNSADQTGIITPLTRSTSAEEIQMDLEADFPIENFDVLSSFKQHTTLPAKRRLCERSSDDGPRKKRTCESADAVSSTSVSTGLCGLQSEYGVEAWKHWLRRRNHQETHKFPSGSLTLTEDVLTCRAAELNHGLCKFLTEVRRPHGGKYSPDSIFYLCLGIQKHLIQNERVENIFTDVNYSRFCRELDKLLKDWKPTVLPSGLIFSRVEEEHLWDSKQLGSFSPGVLLNTLLFFFTKCFNYKTIEQHLQLSFAHVMRCSRTVGKSKVSCLRFYPPREDSSRDCSAAKKSEVENQHFLEIQENSENPLRCPVRLYEFYVSKCSPSVKHLTSHFYLLPEGSCVSTSPTWFSSFSLSSEALQSMLTRILTVRELHLINDKDRL